jgi:hypothetical protein
MVARHIVGRHRGSVRVPSAALGRRLLVAAPVLVAIGTTAPVADAEPQTTAALTLGVVGTGERRALWESTKLHAGLRADVLFGRSGPRDFGVGPYAELGTFGFSDVQLGAGASGLLPVHDDLPIVVSAGAYARAAGGAVEPGLTAQIFWGTRSYNFDSTYGMAAGLLVGGRYGLGASGETAILIGAQLDLRAMALPFVLLTDALRGASPEATRVPR